MRIEKFFVVIFGLMVVIGIVYPHVSDLDYYPGIVDIGVIMVLFLAALLFILFKVARK